MNAPLVSLPADVIDRVGTFFEALGYQGTDFEPSGLGYRVRVVDFSLADRS